MKIRSIVNGVAGRQVVYSGVIVLGSVACALGATFNTIFNNIEQGPGSTASPVIRTSATPEVQKTESEKDGVSAQTSTAASEKTSEAPKRENAPMARSEADREVSRSGPWRVQLGAATSGRAFSAHHALLGLGYFPLSQLGVQAMVRAPLRGQNTVSGLGVGLELEWRPIRIGVLDAERFLELSASAGVSNFQTKNWSGHFGLGAELQLGPRYGLFANYRRGLAQASNQLGANQYAAGLNIRF